MISRKEFKVEGKDIIVYDGIFSQQELFEIYLHIDNRDYRKHNLDDVLHHNKQVDVKWSSEIKNSEILFEILLSKYSTSISEIKDQKYNLLRTYVNYAVPGTVDLIHDDAPHYKKNHYTLLHYGNFTWHSNWHGETVFYDSNYSEILFTSVFKPGRIILFDSSIPHCARPPSKIAEYPRYSIVYKFSLLENEIDQSY